MSNNSIGFSGVLFIVFLVLKLTDNIGWSWWWIASPLWVPLALGASVFATIALGVGISNVVSLVKGRKKKKKKNV